MTFTSEQGDRQTWIALLLVVVGLVGFGTIMVYSASSGLAQLRFDSGHFSSNAGQFAWPSVWQSWPSSSELTTGFGENLGN